MQQIKTKEQLEEKISHCTECLNQKLNSKGKRSVLICGGTGCLANESKEILEKNDSKINIKSELGKGTEVVIRIPTKQGKNKE